MAATSTPLFRSASVTLKSTGSNSCARIPVTIVAKAKAFMLAEYERNNSNDIAEAIMVTPENTVKMAGSVPSQGHHILLDGAETLRPHRSSHQYPLYVSLEASSCCCNPDYRLVIRDPTSAK
jgi:hypothetical protein